MANDAKPNPKLHPDPPTNTEKEPDDWVSGDDPMTGAQVSYLETLAEEAGDAEAYDENLTKAEASKRIDALKDDWVWSDQENLHGRKTRAYRHRKRQAVCAPR